MKHRLALASVLIGVCGCDGGDNDSPTPLPPIDSEAPEDTGGFPIDTSPETGLNEAPLHTLTIEQRGSWDLEPFGGPYVTLTGRFEASEYLDDQRPPDPEDTAAVADYPPDALRCTATFSLVGSLAEDPCPSCDFTFAVEYYLTDGDPEPCRDPDMPTHGEVRRYGFSEDEGMIYLDYGDAGLWLPWWQAVRLGDEVRFNWLVTYGINVEEEDE